MGPPSDRELQPVELYQTGFILQLVMIENRSGCPINLALEVLGDRWSLIVIRDIMFGNRRHFRELLTRSEEGIASNILAARLKRLVEVGLLSRSDDPAHRQKGIYSLTEKAIQLAPVLVQLGAWGRRHLHTSPELAIRQQLMEEGGPQLWSAFADELRHIHLETPLPEGRESVIARLQAAFEQVAAEQRNEAATKVTKNG
jgi:DNA-binding HxlR family transcriptional regulator